MVWTPENVECVRQTLIWNPYCSSRHSTELGIDKILFQATGLGGQAVAGHDSSRVENMNKVTNRSILVRFNADVASSMQWNFRPHQPSVRVLPGETALAFYSAKNPTDKPIIGISTYNIIPYEAAMYFNKIQCFCFEEQRLNPHEQVRYMTVFYI
eukprot:XP_014770716.1 PREDICTED: cytochrome c oxidase assembly protein COX11, mitochondrial-like [Octopus bimaculoides]